MNTTKCYTLSEKKTECVLDVANRKRMKHSFFAMLASFGIGSMGQVNKIGLNVENAFPVVE